MTAIRARSLVVQVYDEVLRRIGSGGAAPGSALGIAELARDLGVSPTPVREALQRLRAEGHLLFVENIGYRLPEPPILGPIDTRLLDEAQAINAEIRSTDFGISQAGIRKFSELNWHFHAKLLALARNPLLDEVHTRLYAAPQFSRIFLGRGILHQAEVVAEHDKVLDELRRGDRVAAAGAQREHIVESLERDARLSDLSISLKRLTAQ